MWIWQRGRHRNWNPLKALNHLTKSTCFTARISVPVMSWPLWKQTNASAVCLWNWNFWKLCQVHCDAHWGLKCEVSYQPTHRGRSQLFIEVSDQHIGDSSLVVVVVLCEARDALVGIITGSGTQLERAEHHGWTKMYCKFSVLNNFWMATNGSIWKFFYLRIYYTKYFRMKIFQFTVLSSIYKWNGEKHLVQ